VKKAQLESEGLKKNLFHMQILSKTKKREKEMCKKQILG